MKNEVRFRFPLPEEVKWIQSLESIKEEFVLSSELRKIGMLRPAGSSMEQQIKKWGIPIASKVRSGCRGHTIAVRRSQVIYALGKSEFLSSHALKGAIDLQEEHVSRWAARNNIGFIGGGCPFLCRQDVMDLIIREYEAEQAKSTSISSGSAAKPDCDPPSKQNGLDSAPPESSVGVDHLRRTAEALLSFAQYSKDLMGRVESLLEKVSDDFETQKKANRVLFRMADEHKTALGKIMASFEISTE